MSDLIISVFRSQPAAFAAGERLAALQREAGTEPEDIVVVTRSAEGRISVNQSTDIATGAPLGGGGWGFLIGMMFIDTDRGRPAAGGLAAQFRAAGLNEAFLAGLAPALENGGAAVGLRVRMLGSSRVIALLEGLSGAPRIHRTRLQADTEDALIDLIARLPQALHGQPVAARKR